MAYTRWSDSNWYSFHNCSSGEAKNEQVLSLWYVGAERLVDLYYEELVEMTPSLLKQFYDTDISKEDIHEAMEIINWFIDDMDKEFQYENDDEE
jgi:hypothetical protein